VHHVQITMSLKFGSKPAAKFLPGEEHTIEVQGYSGLVNMWIHASDGGFVASPPANAQAAACMEAAYSLSPAATHSFKWTAPSTDEAVTISIAQATGPTDAYNTVTVRNLPF
jgi:hypothetical protein